MAGPAQGTDDLQVYVESSRGKWDLNPFQSLEIVNLSQQEYKAAHWAQLSAVYTCEPIRNGL